MIRKKLVANVWIKNEIQLIDSFLERTSEIVDEIVALDNGSTDGTYEVLKAHPKVTVLFRDPPGTPVFEKRMRNRLLDTARERAADWVLILDTDEILDKRLAVERDRLMERDDVAWYHFLEISLWRGTEYFRIDKPDMYMREPGTCRLLRLTPALHWDYAAKRTLGGGLNDLMQLRRRPQRSKTKTVASRLMGGVGEIVYLTNLVRLHYHFADWDRTWRRHVQYALYDAIEHKRSLRDIDEVLAWATDRLDEQGLRLAPVRPEWGVLPVGSSGISATADLSPFVDPDYWSKKDDDA